jgi:Spy/CpxP family protein refolding chaperone
MTTRLDRGSLLASGLIVVMLLAGMAGGVALDRWILRPHAGGQPPAGWTRDGRFDPARVRDRAAGRLARDLKLTPEQRTKMDSLMRRQQREAAAVMQSIRPRLDSVTARTQAELRAVLTAAQQQTFDSLRRERLRHRPSERGLRP